MPKRTDVFGLLCTFVVIYCVLEGTWEPLASLALILAAFAVAMPRMVGRWKVGSTGAEGHFPPTVDGEFELLKPPPRQDPESPQEKGSPED
jgi:hypothetical protein